MLAKARRGSKLYTPEGVPKTPLAFAKRSKFSAVYVIRDRELKRPCKVGISGDPLHRAKSMHTDSWRRLELCSYFWFVGEPVASRVEETAHAMLVEHRVHGEWFDVEAEEAEEAVVLAAMNQKVTIIDEAELRLQHIEHVKECEERFGYELDILDYLERRMYDPSAY